MYISIILYNTINCHAKVFYEKGRTNLGLLSIPRLWREKLAGYNSVFRVCYITSIDTERCRRDPGYVQYHRNNYLSISSFILFLPVLVFLYTYLVVYFVCDSASEFRAVGSTSFFGVFLP